MPASERARTVAVDASVLINLIEAKRMDVLAGLPGWQFVVPDQVVEEITRPDQLAVLEAAIRGGTLRRESSTDPAEIALYADLRQRMGKGEAACLAMAHARGWSVASDDRGRAFRRILRERIAESRVVETQDLIRLAQRATAARRARESPEAERDDVD